MARPANRALLAFMLLPLSMAALASSGLASDGSILPWIGGCRGSATELSCNYSDVYNGGSIEPGSAKMSFGPTVGDDWFPVPVTPLTQQDDWHIVWHPDPPLRPGTYAFTVSVCNLDGACEWGPIHRFTV